MCRFFWIIYQRLYVFLLKKKTNKKVLMIHKVDDSCDNYSISEENFKKMIEFNLDYFQNIDVFFKNENKSGLLLTFDDVHNSVYLNAYPILKKFNIPYILFINLSLINSEGYINYENIYEMLKSSNCKIGNHGLKHDYKRKQNIDDFRKELASSKKEIEMITKEECDLFAFPYGSLYACGLKKFKEAKKIFKYVFSTLPMDYSPEFISIPRININNKNWYKISKELN